MVGEEQKKIEIEIKVEVKGMIKKLVKPKLAILISISIMQLSADAQKISPDYRQSKRLTAALKQVACR